MKENLIIYIMVLIALIFLVASIYTYINEESVGEVDQKSLTTS